MDFGASFAKYVLFIFNMLVLVCGILVITFGSIVLANTGDIRNFADNINVTGVPITLIVIGCIITFISFLGCWGAIRENTCLTMIYSAVMLFLLVLQMIIVFYVWLKQDSFLNGMNTIVKTAWTKRHENSQFMDVLQMEFKCCGQFGVKDYLNEKIPNSCCGPSATSCSNELAITKPGCSSAFRSFWLSNLVTAKYAGLVVAAVELVSFIFACCIANQARNERRRAAYY